MSAIGYPIPVGLPRRRRIVSPGEWLRERVSSRERERETIERAIAFDATQGTATNSSTLTVGTAAASGSLVVLFAWWFGTQTFNNSFSAAGLSWDQVPEQERGTIAGDQNIAIAYAQAPSGLSTGSKDMSAAFSATPDFGPGLAMFSFTGLATSSPLDASADFLEDFNETWTTNNLVTTTADTAIVAMSVVDDAAATHSAAANYTEAFTEFQAEGSQMMAGVYRIVSSTGTYNPGGTWSGTANFQHSLAAAFKIAGGAPPAVPKLRLHLPPLRLR